MNRAPVFRLLELTQAASHLSLRAINCNTPSKRWHCRWPASLRGLLLLSFLALFTPLVTASAAANNGSEIVLKFCYFKWAPYGNYISSGVTNASISTKSHQEELPEHKNAGYSHEGIAIDIIRAAGDKLGQPLSFHQEPYKRCMAAVANNQYDGIAYYVPNNHRGITPVDKSFMGHLAAFFVQQQSPHHYYKGLVQFSNQTIAVLRGGSSVPWLAQNKDINIYRVNRQDYLWQMIRGERVDASIDDYVTFITTGKHKTHKVRALLPPARYAPTHIGFRIGLSYQAAKWEQALEEIQKEGTIDRIYQQHVGERYRELLQYRSQSASN